MINVDPRSLTLLLIIVLSLTQPLTLIKVYEYNGGVNLGFFKPVLSFNHKYKPNTLTPVYSNKGLVTGFYTDVDVTVILNDQYLRLQSVGSKKILVINDYLLLTGVSLGLDTYVISLSNMSILKNLNVDLNVKYLGYVGVLFKGGSIDQYLYVEDVNGVKKLIQLSYDFFRNEFKLNTSSVLYVKLNVAYGYPNGKQGPLFVVLNSSVNLFEHQGFTYIEINGSTIAIEASLRDLSGVYVYGESIVLVFSKEGGLITLSHSRGSIREKTFQHIDATYVVPALNHLIVVLKNSAGLKLIYLNPYLLVVEKELVIDREVFSVLNVDLDGDGFVEVIRLEECHYVAETTGGFRTPIYWTKLRQPIGLSLIALTLSDVHLIAIHRSGDVYDIEVLILDRSIEVDYTPPVINLHNPTKGFVYRNPVKVVFELGDRESGVFSSKVELMRNNEVIYSNLYVDTFVEEEFNLTPGAYCLKIEAWNNFGFSSVEQIVFYVVDYDIAILSPRNYSIISTNINLTVVSYAEYSIDIYLNNSFYKKVTLNPGLNTIDLTISVEGTIYIKLIVEETMRTHILVLTVDSTKPVVEAYGLTNETTYSNVMVFNIYVYDQHLCFMKVNVGGYTALYTQSNGNYTIVFNTLRLNDGPVLIEIYAEDLAGNTNGLIYVVTISNPVDFNLTVDPLINGSYVSGVVELRVFSNSPEVYVFINDKQLSTFLNEWGVDEKLLINTAGYSDGVYYLTFKSVFKGGFVEKKIVWFIDNNPPVVDLKLPVVIGKTPWVNGSYAPVFNPELNRSYLSIINGSFFYPIYIKAVDRWIDEVTLYINGSLATVLTEGSERLSMFKGNVSLVTYIKVPGSGLYYLRLEARDQSGKRSYVVLKVLFDFDKPWVNVLEPINGTITNLESVRFVLVTKDNHSRLCALGLNIRLNATKPSLMEYYPLPNRTIFLCGSRVSFEVSFKRESTYYVWFLAIDQSYNTYETFVKLVIDRTAPILKYSYSLNGSTLNLSIGAYDENGVKNVSIYLNNTLIYVTNETRFNINLPLYGGLNVVKIEAEDFAGNRGFNVIELNVTENLLENTTKLEVEVEHRTMGETNYIIFMVIFGSIISASIALIIVAKRRRKD